MSTSSLFAKLSTRLAGPPGQSGILLRAATILVVAVVAQDTFGAADTLAGAKYDVVDRFDVNMASGQVQIEQTTLSIGGDMGLSHRISSLTSDFVNIAGHGGGVPTVYGFGDTHRGGLYTLALRKDHPFPQYWRFGVRVFGSGASADFVLTSAGDFVPYKTPSSDILEFQSDAQFTGYVYTTGDGTRIFYPMPGRITYIGVNTFIRRPISRIEYPSGFTVEINLGPSIDGSIRSVRTNTGFQLNYDFTGTWTGSSPTRVTALNNRYERCPFLATACSPSSYWPYATYTWPVGKPNSYYVQTLNRDSIFAVRDAEGRVTEYHHSPYQPEVGPFAPRLVRIKKNGRTVRTYDYEFNQYAHSSSSNHSIIQTTGVATVDVASEPGGGTHHYTMHIPKFMYGAYTGNINGGGGGPGSVNLVESSSFGALIRIDSWEQDIRFAYGLAYDSQLAIDRITNWVASVKHKRGGITTTYLYDDRGNVTRRTENGVSTHAQYPTSCTISNRKYCNKPVWTEDARGNRTYFTYHPQSGQVATRTLPPNSSGISPRTVYQYAAYYAHYKKDSEAIEAADTPIWLLATERTCQKSAMRSDNTCVGNDDIVTDYQYDYYNLYLRGVAVTAKNAQGILETRRNCYEYDKFGNRIGETSPRANLATCP